jgi:hypothetical protein
MLPPLQDCTEKRQVGGNCYPTSASFLSFVDEVSQVDTVQALQRNVAKLSL